jgi:hypothetical protein
MVKDQNSVFAKELVNTVNTKFNEMGNMLISTETMDFYFKKVEELYTKLAKCNNNINILKTHLANNTVPKALSCFNFPYPMFSEDFNFVEKYNQLINDQQKQIINLNIEHIQTQIDQINNDLFNYKQLLKTKSTDIEKQFGLIKLRVEDKLSTDFEKSDIKCKNSILHKFTAIDNIGRKKVNNTTKKKSKQNTRNLYLDYNESSSHDEDTQLLITKQQANNNNNNNNNNNTNPNKHVKSNNENTSNTNIKNNNNKIANDTNNNNNNNKNTSVDNQKSSNNVDNYKQNSTRHNYSNNNSNTNNTQNISNNNPKNSNNSNNLNNAKSVFQKGQKQKQAK